MLTPVNDLDAVDKDVVDPRCVGIEPEGFAARQVMSRIGRPTAHCVGIEDDDVGMVAGGEVQHDRPTEQVGDQVELGRPAAAGYANGLILRRFLGAPAAGRCAFTWVLSKATVPPMRPCSTRLA